MNWFQRFYNEFIDVNLADYENIGLNLPINQLLFFLTIGLCAAIIVIGRKQRAVSLILKKLIRKDCYTEENAKTLAELGLSGEDRVKKLLRSGAGYLKKTVLRVGARELTYEEYEALLKAEKAAKANKKGKPHEDIANVAEADSMAEIKAEGGTAEAPDEAQKSSSENLGGAKTVAEFYSFNINEAKFYIPEDKKDYAARLLAMNDTTVTKTVLGCTFVFGFYLILFFTMPTLLSWVNALLG